MRKIILNLAVSLDGFIEGPNGEYDWCFTDQDYGMTAFLEDTDAILLGRKSYELLESVEPGAYPGKMKYVFSTTLNELPGREVQLIREDAYEAIRSLKAETGKNIWLFGGAILTHSLMEAGLIDELVLSIHPLILGSGKRLFIDMETRKPLRLTATKAFTGGLVQLYYDVT